MFVTFIDKWRPFSKGYLAHSAARKGILDAHPESKHAAQAKCMVRIEGPSYNIGRMKVAKVHGRSERKLQ
jgi:hypothetical protein